MTTLTLKCAVGGCDESITMAGGDGPPRLGPILKERGWTHEPGSELAYCGIHTPLLIEEAREVLKTREEIDSEILTAVRESPGYRTRVLGEWPTDELAGQPLTTLPTESKARKAIPIVRGFLDYFPAAAAAVAQLSLAGNEKHNPGEELHHARGKSTDHADCIVRHLMERGTVDPEDGIRHSVKVAWRALALLQEELEREENAPLARGARLP